MKTIKNKKLAPMIGCQPSEMMPLDQILCMMWLADNHTLEELRERQNMIKQQKLSAVERNLPETTFAELVAMQSNTDAAVAYQTWPNDIWWLAHILTGDK